MKYAADFRYIAREALRGKWLVAVLTAFVASLIGAQIASGGGGGGSNNDENEGINLRYHLSEETLVMLQTIATVIGIIAVVGFIIALIIGGAGKLGYARFNLNLVDGKEVVMTVKSGDKVLISEYAGTKVKIEGEELIIVRQSDILAIVE